MRSSNELSRDKKAYRYTVPKGTGILYYSISGQKKPILKVPINLLIFLF